MASTVLEIARGITLDGDVTQTCAVRAPPMANKSITRNRYHRPEIPHYFLASPGPGYRCLADYLPVSSALSAWLF